VDKAIDLGISLEAMMLHNQGQERERGELRYRTAIRGAAFLGGALEERQKHFKLLREAYDLRSEAVHAGRLAEKGSKRRDASPILAETGALVFQIAKQIIREGGFPSWEDRVLGG
jgi:hypothetical protein